MWDPAAGKCDLLQNVAPELLGGPLGITDYDSTPDECFRYGSTGSAGVVDMHSIASLAAQDKTVAETIKELSPTSTTSASGAPGTGGTWATNSFEGTPQQFLLWRGDDGRTWILGLTQKGAASEAAKKRILTVAKKIDAYIVKDGSAAGGTSAAKTSGAIDKNIEKFDWANATYRVKAFGKTVKLSNGNWDNPDEMGGVRVDPAEPASIAYGDVNNDGIEDALVTASAYGSTGLISAEVSLWLGTKNAAPQQSVVAFTTMSECWDNSIDRMSITDGGDIEIGGTAAVLGGPCANGSGGGAPYTAKYRYSNGTIQTVVAPPSVG